MVLQSHPVEPALQLFIGRHWAGDAQVRTVKFAHEGAVYDIKWSPFSPYWFATAGEDAMVRACDPCRVLRGVFWCDIERSGLV